MWTTRLYTISFAVQYAPFSAILTLFTRGGTGTIEHGQLPHHAAQRELPDCLQLLTCLLDNDGCSESTNKLMYQDCLDDYLDNMLAGIGTPLQLAAGKGLLDVVEYLVARGANPLIKDPRATVALDWASDGGHTEVVEFLRPLSDPIFSHELHRHDFADGPGFHFKLMPLTEFLKMGRVRAVIHV